MKKQIAFLLIIAMMNSVVCYSDEWLQIRYNWRRGWVRSKYAEIY